MRFLEPTFALLALPTAIIAVSLSDFTPRVSNLPSGCQSVYTESIDGCSASDFGKPSCSKACIEALDEFTTKVKGACGSKGIEGDNIVTTFISGGGPASLCTNADAVLGGGSSDSSSSSSSSSASSTSESASAKASSSTAPSSSSTTSTSSIATSSSAPETSSTAVLSGTATATSLSTATSTAGDSSSGILVDTSTQPTASSTSSSSGNSQTNLSDNSGGGSPFDSEGNMSSAAAISTISFTTMFLTTAIVLLNTLR